MTRWKGDSAHLMASATSSTFAAFNLFFFQKYVSARGMKQFSFLPPAGRSMFSLVCVVCMTDAVVSRLTTISLPAWMVRLSAVRASGAARVDGSSQLLAIDSKMHILEIGTDQVIVFIILNWVRHSLNFNDSY